jgi:hypothetical protein
VRARARPEVRARARPAARATIAPTQAVLGASTSTRSRGWRAHRSRRHPTARLPVEGRGRVHAARRGRGDPRARADVEIPAARPKRTVRAVVGGVAARRPPRSDKASSPGSSPCSAGGRGRHAGPHRRHRARLRRPVDETASSSTATTATRNGGRARGRRSPRRRLRARRPPSRPRAGGSAQAVSPLAHEPPLPPHRRVVDRAKPVPWSEASELGADRVLLVEAARRSWWDDAKAGRRSTGCSGSPAAGAQSRRARCRSSTARSGWRSWRSFRGSWWPRSTAATPPPSGAPGGGGWWHRSGGGFAPDELTRWARPRPASAFVLRETAAMRVRRAARRRTFSTFPVISDRREW